MLEIIKTKADNKYQIDNVSSEDIDEVLKLYYKECQCKNRVFIKLMNDITQQIDEAKSHNGCYEILSLL